MDIGGTFTDIVSIDEKGNTDIFKTLSTPRDQSVGLLNGLEKAARFYGISLEEYLKNIGLLVHGTTVATNACLEHKGAKTGLITTKGFRDALEMRRAHKEDIWDLSLDHPSVLVPRYLRMGVTERLDYNGNVLVPLDEKEMIEVISKLKNYGVESIAVCTLFSYMNDIHEKRIKQIAKEEFAEAYVSISSEIVKQIREYERTSTTVLNAYTGPILSRYLRNLETLLKNKGFRQVVLVTQSNGGVMTIELATKLAVATLFSGPAAGAIGGNFFSHLLNAPNLIVCDMGGTSFDVTLIKDHEYTLTTEGEIGGYKSSLPMIDIHTIGAGGGSIAYVDKGGLLKVGPQSAGADPGPACYGREGKEPTVTDTNLILGYLNPNFFAGGEIPLDYDASYKAIEEKIAKPLGISVVEAAHGIFKVINSNMADAIRVVSVERGHDPRDFYLVSAGGACSIHAVKLVQEVGTPRIIVPTVASVFCALGMLEADLKHDFVRTFRSKLSALDVRALNRVFDELGEEGKKLLIKEGIRKENMRIRKSLDMRYVGQHHEVLVEIPSGELAREDIEEIKKIFHGAHEKLYTYSDLESDIEIINARTTAIGIVPKVEIKRQEWSGKSSEHALKDRREVYFEEFGGFVQTPVYDRSKLKYGNTVEGPAILEEVTTTTVVFPGSIASIDPYGNVVIEVS